MVFTRPIARIFLQVLDPSCPEVRSHYPSGPDLHSSGLWQRAQDQVRFFLLTNRVSLLYSSFPFPSYHYCMVSARCTVGKSSHRMYKIFSRWTGGNFWSTPPSNLVQYAQKKTLGFKLTPPISLVRLETKSRYKEKVLLLIENTCAQPLFRGAVYKALR